MNRSKLKDVYFLVSAGLQFLIQDLRKILTLSERYHI